MTSPVAWSPATGVVDQVVADRMHRATAADRAIVERTADTPPATMLSPTFRVLGLCTSTLPPPFAAGGRVAGDGVELPCRGERGVGDECATADDLHSRRVGVPADRGVGHQPVPIERVDTTAVTSRSGDLVAADRRVVDVDRQVGVGSIAGLIEDVDAAVPSPLPRRPHCRRWSCPGWSDWSPTCRRRRWRCHRHLAWPPCPPLPEIVSSVKVADPPSYSSMPPPNVLPCCRHVRVS